MLPLAWSMNKLLPSGPEASGSYRDVGRRPPCWIMERAQPTFALQLDDSLQVLLARTLPALSPLAEIAIGSLSSLWSSSHVSSRGIPHLVLYPVAVITEYPRQVSRAPAGRGARGSLSVGMRLVRRHAAR